MSIIKDNFTGTTDFEAIDAESISFDNGSNTLNFVKTVTLVFNGGTIPANSTVTDSTTTIAGADDIGMVALVNCNAPIDQLIYTATIDPDSTVNLHITNPTTTARASGNRSYTLTVIGVD